MEDAEDGERRIKNDNNLKQVDESLRLLKLAKKS